MPHILLKRHEKVSLQDTKHFKFIANSKYDEKICAVYDDKEFLLTKVDKKGDDLVKLDNTTRLTPVSLMKKALNDYANLSEAEVLFSNTNSIYNKLKPEEKYLKDINYFVNEFSTDKEIWVEVGFGSGTHLLHQASQNKDKIIIGLEIHYPSIEQVLKQTKLQNIQNILVIKYDARLFLEFLKSNSVGRVFVHFPVPWDKKPHRRVMSVAFIQECMRVLKVDGTLELRTDSPNYFEYTTELLKSFKRYDTKIYTNKDLDVTSKYEARWKRQEKTIWDVIIKANEHSKQVELEDDFSFAFVYDKQILKNKITTETIRKEDHFVHFEDVYDVDSNDGYDGLLIKLTMGDFNMPVGKYLLLNNGNIRYFQGEPIKTKSNLNAHKTILEILK